MPSELSGALCALRLCPLKAQEAMRRSLSTLGQLTPVLAWRTGASDSLQIFDGLKPWRAAQDLSWPTLRVKVHTLDGVGAKARLLKCNAAAGLSDLEEAWVVRSLYREDKLTQGQIAKLLDRPDRSWVCRRLTLAEGLCDELTPKVRLGLVSTTACRELVRLPEPLRVLGAAVTSLLAALRFPALRAARLLSERRPRVRREPVPAHAAAPAVDLLPGSHPSTVSPRDAVAPSSPDPLHHHGHPGVDLVTAAEWISATPPPKSLPPGASPLYTGPTGQLFLLRESE